MLKVPHQLHQIADELGIDLESECEQTDDLGQLIIRFREELVTARGEAAHYYDGIETTLNEIAQVTKEHRT